MPSKPPHDWAKDKFGLRTHLDSAKTRMLETQRVQDLPDPILLRDLQVRWVVMRERLLRDLDKGQYTSAGVEIIDLPKDRLAVRPLVRLQPLDQLLYEALIFALQPELDRRLPNAVYSYRWDRRRGRMLSGVKQWVRLQDLGRAHHRRSPGLYLAKTDISSFYEHVDVRILKAQLLQILGPRREIKLLVTFLRDFAERNQVAGLPQGSDASGVLANVYLLPVDLHLRDRKCTFLRYSDDIWLFGPDWDSLRGELIGVTRVLRGIRLHLANAKTSIVSGADVMQEFEQAEKNAISYGLQVRAPGAIKEVRELFDRAVQESEAVLARDVRFTLPRLGKAQDPHAVPWLLRHLSAVPHLAKEVNSYLSRFTTSDPRIWKTALRVLRRGDLIHYPYAEMHLIRLLLPQPIASKGRGTALMWQLLRDRNRQDFVREYAARYVGLHSRPGDVDHLKALLKSETDPRLRRVLLIAVYEAGGASRKWLRHPTRNTPELRDTARYLLTSPQIPRP